MVAITCKIDSKFTKFIWYFVGVLTIRVDGVPKRRHFYFMGNSLFGWDV